MTDIKKPLREGRRAEHTGQDFTAPAGADAGMDRGEPSRRRGAFESRWHEVVALFVTTNHQPQQCGSILPGEVASDSGGLCRRPVSGRLGEPRGCRMEDAAYTSYGIKAWEG